MEIKDFYGLAMLTTAEDYYAYASAEEAARSAAAKAALAVAGGLAIAEKDKLEETILRAIDKIISQAQDIARTRGKERWKRCAPCDPKVGVQD